MTISRNPSSIFELFLPSGQKYTANSKLFDIFALGKDDTKKTAEMLIWVMYCPSRFSFLVWGPWLAGEAGR